LLVFLLLQCSVITIKYCLKYIARLSKLMLRFLVNRKFDQDVHIICCSRWTEVRRQEQVLWCSYFSVAVNVQVLTSLTKRTCVEVSFSGYCSLQCILTYTLLYIVWIHFNYLLYHCVYSWWFTLYFNCRVMQWSLGSREQIASTDEQLRLFLIIGFVCEVFVERIDDG